MHDRLKSAPTIFLTGVAFVIFLSGQAQAAGCSASGVLNSYSAEYAKSRSVTASMRRMTKRLDDSLKPSKALKEMMAGVSDGTLAKEVQKAVHMRSGYKIDPRTLRSAKMGRYSRSLELTEQPALPRLSATFKAFTTIVSAAHLLTNLEAAITSGNRDAILDMNKQAGELGMGIALSRAGMRAAKLGSAVAGFLDYALTSLIVQELSGYEEYWWRSYRAYLNKRYPKMVGGGNSWADLAMRDDKGHAFKARLQEFWSDIDGGDGISSALERATHYYKAPQGLRRGDALSMARYRDSFAARYYRDFLKTTIDTFLSRKVANEKAALNQRADAAATALCSYLNDLESLARDVQKLVNEKPAELTAEEKAFFKECNARLKEKNRAKSEFIPVRDSLGAWRVSSLRSVRNGFQKIDVEKKVIKDQVDAKKALVNSLISGAPRDDKGKISGGTAGKIKSETAEVNQLIKDYNILIRKKNKTVKIHNALLKVSNKDCSVWLPKFGDLSEIGMFSIAEGQNRCQAFLQAWPQYIDAHNAMNEIGKQCNAINKKRKKLAAQNKK
jgi:hypothetical protein